MNIEMMEMEIQRLQATLDSIENVCSEGYVQTAAQLEKLTKLLNETKKVESEDRKVELNYILEEERNEESKRRRKAETTVKVVMIVAAVGLGLATIYAEGTRVITSKGVQMAARLLKF